MATLTEDEENPRMGTRFLFFKDADPGIGQMGISIFANVIFSHMLVYGLTGRGQRAMLASILTVPISGAMCIRDSSKDYEKWKEMRVLKQKGVPDRFLPYKCKYDWTDYDIKLESRKKAALQSE